MIILIIIILLTILIYDNNSNNDITINGDIKILLKVNHKIPCLQYVYFVFENTLLVLSMLRE